MKKFIALLFCSILSIVNSFSQEKQELRNLDFESVSDNKPIGWKNFGSSDYSISIDTKIAKNGNNSAFIEYDGNSSDFKAWAYNIPADYGGKKIKLTGYIKTENVTDGYAGLWMRIDPQVAFDNMNNRGVKGTSDWKKYEIELDLKPSQARLIVVGGLLVGKGKMWIDDLKITIDGKSLENAPEKELLPAAKDSEFNTGSKIIIPELNNQIITDLDLLGRVWGFLKYYHPEVGKGNYNWDFELFRMMPDYIKASDKVARDTMLLKWIEKYGGIAECKSCKETPEDSFLKPDLKWMDSNALSPDLKAKLKYIQKNRHQGDHFYIGMTANVGNPEFKNERAYIDIGVYPDDGFRLLTLFKYWNIIQYYFPYRHLMDKDWSTTLTEYIPKFINAKNELEFELAAIQLIGDVKDTHANLWGGNNAIQDQRGEFFPPVHVRFIEGRLVVTDYYNPEMKKSIGLELGDVITKINGKTIEDLVKEVNPYYPASNQPTRLRDISADLLRSNSNTISINYIRKQKEESKELSLFEKNKLDYYRWYRRDPEGKSYKMLDNNIGYVTLKNIKLEDIEEIKAQFINTKGIVVDIRNYPSAFTPFLLGSYFTSDHAPFVKFTNGNVDNPGEFTFGKDLSISAKGKTYKGKVVVIVNELTQSSAEYTSMAFRAGDNVTILGSTTAGADGNVSRITLPGGLNTMISGIGVNYPDGTETQRIGIVPDVEVLPTIEGIKNGKDEPLEKALDIILKNIGASNKIKD